MSRRDREEKRRILRERLMRRLQNAAGAKGQAHFEIVGGDKKWTRKRS